jgi:glutamine synthetase
MDIDEIRRICEERAIHTVECAFPDTHGIPRGKRIPVRHFLDVAHRGFDIANAALVWDRRCDVIQTVAYANFNTGYPDMRAVPDLDTFRPVPWRPGAASVLCDCLEEDGSPVAIATRGLLRQVVEEARTLGYEPMVGSELEFYLLDAEGRPLYDGVDCYSLTRGATLEPVLARIRRELEEFGTTIEACNTEYGPAQVEVNIRYGPALDTADRTMLFRSAVKEIAADCGLRATFMAKPFARESGSGFHLHQSLSDLSTGENLFARADRGGVESCPAMRAYLGGLLAHARAISALGAPTVNAYKRVQGYTFAPTNVTWGIDNRTVTVRAIVGHGPANRLEWRAGAADCNPYLLIAGCVAAGLDGIRQDRAVPEAVHGDAYSLTDAEPLPLTLEEALDALQQSELGAKALGTFLDVFVALGRHEVDLWRSAVTDWELARYLDG